MDEIKDVPGADEETEVVEMAPFFGSTQDLIQKYSHCTLCGSHLHFVHVTDFAKDLTHETARCLECGVQVRKVMHRLQ